MERMCGFHSIDEYADKALLSPECLLIPTDHDHYSDQSLLFSGDNHLNISPFGSERESGSSTFQCSGNISESAQRVEEDEETCKAIKTQIASHPSFPRLLDAYINCQKVGAPPEITSLLDEIKQESGFCRRDGTVATTCLGDDPKLDDFMDTYCDILVKYKSDLERPFDEATTFINKIQIQLGNLGKDDSSEEELSGGENTEEEEHRLRNEEDREVKERLLKKYGDRLSALKIEFSKKKKKKGKLPKEAKHTLLQWWNSHYKWPYPTETDKIYLAEITGLDQKQINNWFINQRKRHWKPSENMQFAVMGNFSGQFNIDD